MGRGSNGSTVAVADQAGGDPLHRPAPVKQKPNELVGKRPETLTLTVSSIAEVRLSCNCRAGGLIKRSARADLLWVKQTLLNAP